MSKKSKNVPESHIFTSFYDFNKWLHAKDWISQNVLQYQANFPHKPMDWGYSVAVVNQK